jgi:hypothetical protein
MSSAHGPGDVLVIGGNISGSPERTKLEVLAAREAFDCVIFVELCAAD